MESVKLIKDCSLKVLKFRDVGIVIHDPDAFFTLPKKTKEMKLTPIQAHDSIGKQIVNNDFAYVVKEVFLCDPHIATEDESINMLYVVESVDDDHTALIIDKSDVDLNCSCGLTSDDEAYL